MARIRQPFQGVWNIIRFNWHFYALLGIIVPVVFFLLNRWASIEVSVIVAGILIVPILISLLVSYYVYDRSELYQFNVLSNMTFEESDLVVNINAGFDETSEIIHSKFPKATLKVFDFYNPERHTEVSIKRARKAYPPYPGSAPIKTTQLPLDDSSVSAVFLIMSAHEIRDQEERKLFFKEIHRILSPGGKLVVVEHLRDLPNFLAYTVGVFHFFSKRNWLKIYLAANLKLQKEIKITPFVSTFILTKNGASS